MEYALHLFIVICLYLMLSQSLNLSAGFSGLISLSQAGFYGLGAYTSAIFSTQFNMSFWATLVIAIVFSAIIAFLVSLIALRTVEDYFIICTLGIQIIIFSLMNNLTHITRGPLGIPGIPSITLFSFNFKTKISFLLLSIFFAGLIWIAIYNITKSGFGKILRALKEDEIYVQSIGKNVYKAKIVSFTLSSCLAAVPGALYAHYISYIDPSSFSVNESIFILSIVIIGGLGNLKGGLFAVAFLVLLPEAFRFIGIPDQVAANIRQICYGLILTIIMLVGREKATGFIRKYLKNFGKASS